MRGLKLIAITGLILAMSASAWAAGIPFREAWTGPIYMHINDLAQGTTYNGLLTDGTPATTGVWYTPDQLQSLAPNGANGEDGWSIFQVDSIYKGFWFGANTIGPIDMANPLYIHADAGKEVVGTIFNRVDLLVRINADMSFDFESAGDTFEVFAQPLGTYAAHDPGVLDIMGESGSSLRIAGQDKYVGIGYDAAGNPIPVAERALRMESVVGYFGDEIDPHPLHPSTEVSGNFKPDVVIPGTGSGVNDEYTEVLGEFNGDPAMPDDAAGPYYGYQDELFGQFNIFSPTKPWGGPRADLRVHTTNSPIGLRPNVNYDWLVQSSDPVTGALIPEPMTMLGVFLGLSGLGAYIRKRRLS